MQYCPTVLLTIPIVFYTILCGWQGLLCIMPRYRSRVLLVNLLMHQSPQDRQRFVHAAWCRQFHICSSMYCEHMLPATGAGQARPTPSDPSLRWDIESARGRCLSSELRIPTASYVGHVAKYAGPIVPLNSSRELRI